MKITCNINLHAHSLSEFEFMTSIISRLVSQIPERAFSPCPRHRSYVHVQSGPSGRCQVRCRYGLGVRPSKCFPLPTVLESLEVSELLGAWWYTSAISFTVHFSMANTHITILFSACSGILIARDGDEWTAPSALWLGGIAAGLEGGAQVSKMIPDCDTSDGWRKGGREKFLKRGRGRGEKERRRIKEERGERAFNTKTGHLERYCSPLLHVELCALFAHVFIL